MGPRSRLNLVLLISVAALVAVVLVVLRGDEQPPPRLTTIDPTTIAAISISRGDDPAVELRRTDSAWRMTAPVAAEAEPFAMRRLLAVLTEQVSEPLAAGPDYRERYGLAPPTATVRYDGLALEFGAAHPIGNRRYVALGESVYLIPDNHIAVLNDGYAGLVARRLLPTGAALQGLALPGLDIERDANGAWTGAEATRRSADDLVALARAWETTSALRVQAATVDAPTDLRVTLRDGRTLSFVIVAREPELVLARPDLGIEYHLPDADAERLLQPPAGNAAPTDG